MSPDNLEGDAAHFPIRGAEPLRMRRLALMHPLAPKIHLVAAWTERPIEIFAIEVGSLGNRTYSGSMVSMPHEMESRTTLS
jgi:hypothetical protein